MISLRIRDFMLTSGSVPRLDACPASRVFEGHDDEGMKPWMWYGIGVHEFLEKVQTNDREEALACIEREFRRCLKTCEAIDVDAIPRGEAEVAYAHHGVDERERVFLRGFAITLIRSRPLESSTRSPGPRRPPSSSPRTFRSLRYSFGCEGWV